MSDDHRIDKALSEIRDELREHKSQMNSIVEDLKTLLKKENCTGITY